MRSVLCTSPHDCMTLLPATEEGLLLAEGYIYLRARPARSMVLRTHGQVRERIVASSVGADNKSNLNAPAVLALHRGGSGHAPGFIPNISYAANSGHSIHG